MSGSLAPRAPHVANEAGQVPLGRAVIAVVQPPGSGELSLARVVRTGGYDALAAKDLERVRTLLRRHHIDAAVAHVDALEAIGRLAAVMPSALPVLVVVDPRLVHPGDALDAGADDVVGIPVDPDELVARLRAALRRANPPGAAPVVISTPDFTIDLANRSCRGPDGDIHLTRIEWQLVDTLCRRPGRLVSAQCLREGIWGPAEPPSGGWLRVHMCSLRKKLEPNPHEPRYFRTEAGLGVRFVPGCGTPVTPRCQVTPR